MKSGLYIITNLRNNKHYIGQTKNVYKRISQQKSNLKNKFPTNKHLQADYDNGRPEDFAFEIILFCPLGELENWEKFYIALFQSNNRDFGYNIEAGGFTTKEIGAETIELWKIQRKGKIQPESAKEIWRQNRKRGDNSNSLKVTHIESGKIWNCARDAAEELGINYFTFMGKISGKDKNNTGCTYLEKREIMHPSPVYDIETGQKWDDYSLAAAELGYNPGTLRKWLGGQRDNVTNLRYVK
jgi:group I intron endonuclease